MDLSLKSNLKNITGILLQRRDRENFLKPCVLIFFSMLFAGLIASIGIGNNYFWDDEANTAFIGRSFAKTLTLTAWDGRNLLSYGMDGGINKNMQKLGPPPLQYIIAGVSQKLFGDDTAGTRLLFLFIGLLTIPLAAAWAKNEFNLKKYWITAFVLSLTVPFHLFITQARYYSLGLTFAFCVMWAWSCICKSRHPILWCILASTFLFLLIMSQYLYAAATMTVLLLSLLRQQYRNVRNLTLLSIFIFIGLVALVGMRFYAPYILQLIIGKTEISFSLLASQSLKLFLLSLRDVNSFELFPVGIFAFVVLGFFLFPKITATHLKSVALLSLYCLAVILVISVLSPQRTSTLTLSDSQADVRYYILLIPFSAIMATIIFEMFWINSYRRTSILFLCLLLSSNLLTFNFLSSSGFHIRIYQYLTEVFNDYPTRSEVVSEYISKNILPNKCIFIVPMFENITQIYYNPAHKFCGLVSNNAKFSKKYPDRLRYDLFFEEAIPDYFIVSKFTARNFIQYCSYVYGDSTYELETVLPVSRFGSIRPEIIWHTFGAIKYRDEPSDGVFIFRRTNAKAHVPKISAKEAEKALQF